MSCVSAAQPGTGADAQQPPLRSGFRAQLRRGVGLQKSEVEHAWSRVVRVSSTSGRGGLMPVLL
jgi:hypothetical protein